MKNPLWKRMPREIIGDWKKYLVIFIFMVLMIGASSGVYVANGSMEKTISDAKESFYLEDGNFELNKKADKKLINSIENCKRADVKKYYLDEAYKKAEKEAEKIVKSKTEEEVKKQIESAVSQQAKTVGITDKSVIDEQIKKATKEQYKKTLEEVFKSSDYKNALDKAKKETKKEAKNEVENEYSKIEERYNLNKKDFVKHSVELFENFYKEVDEDNGSKKGVTARIYQTRDNIDLADVIEGRFPEKENEIAIDRMHADNLKIKVGDIIKFGKKVYKISGLIACVNYSTLFTNNTDTMFDSITFDVAMVTPEAFKNINARTHYNYAWKYKKAPTNDVENAEFADNLMLSIVSNCAVNDNKINDYIPAYINQSINFAPNDMGSDEAMIGILIYILTAVIAFIFGITISNTIVKEASVIGTLRASGYTKGELLIHFITIPFLITFLGAIVGNILGYTLFKNVVVDMYYNSYSLMNYKTVMSPEALLKTTIIPIILIVVINFVIIGRMLKFSPLRFLRHDLSNTKRTKARRLPKWSFMKRFRLRILGQNIPNYCILLAGILFIEVMLAMAVGFPDSLNKYKNKADSMMICNYQTILMDYRDNDNEIIHTAIKGAETFANEELTYDNGHRKEDISAYGIQNKSKYIKLPELDNNEITVSSAFAEKYNLKSGDYIKLNEKYTYGKYKFKVKDITEYDGGVAVFMPIEKLNETFDNDKDSFNGFFSDKPLNDIDEDYIATVITKKDITKLSCQLDHSMGSYMLYFQYVCIALSAVLIYLLTKIIVEKNENSISMAKVLGFTNGEINSLYIHTTTLLVLLFTLVSEAAGIFVMQLAFKEFMLSTDGWFKFYISPEGIIKMYAFVIIGYIIVTILDRRRIARIPLNVALKDVE